MNLICFFKISYCHKFPTNSLFANEKPSRNDVNPSHLYNGSPSSNTKDSVPYRKSFKTKPSVISAIKAELIKTDFKNSGDVAKFDLKIAKQYDLSLAVIQEIRLSCNRVGSNKKQVAQYNCDGTLIKVFNSVKEADLHLRNNLRNVNHSSGISLVANGRNKSHAGYLWKYLSD